MLREIRRVFETFRYHYKRPHVVRPLRETFTRNIYETYHMIAVSADTDAELKISEWVRRGIKLKERRGMVKGYYFIDRKGRKLDATDMESHILVRIERIQTCCLYLIRTSIDIFIRSIKHPVYFREDLTWKSRIEVYLSRR